MQIFETVILSDFKFTQDDSINDDRITSAYFE